MSSRCNPGRLRSKTTSSPRPPSFRTFPPLIGCIPDGNHAARPVCITARAYDTFMQIRGPGVTLGGVRVVLLSHVGIIFCSVWGCRVAVALLSSCDHGIVSRSASTFASVPVRSNQSIKTTKYAIHVFIKYFRCSS